MLEFHIRNLVDKDLILYRREIGPNINYIGGGSIRELTMRHENSFILVDEESHLMQTLNVFKIYNRDYDVLDDSLGMIQIVSNQFMQQFNSLIFRFDISGAISSQYNIESAQYISERLMKKIDQVTSSMMENGLHQFYSSMNEFRQKFIDREYSIEEQDSFKALAMKQLKRPMILIFGLWVVAVIVLVGERIISKWIEWYILKRN